MDLRNVRSIRLVQNEHSISLCTRSLLLMQLPLTNPSNIHRLPLWWINLKKLWQLSLYQSRFYIWRAHTLTWEIWNNDEQKSRFWKSYYFFYFRDILPIDEAISKAEQVSFKGFLTQNDLLYQLITYCCRYNSSNVAVMCVFTLITLCLLWYVSFITKQGNVQARNKDMYSVNVHLTTHAHSHHHITFSEKFI